MKKIILLIGLIGLLLGACAPTEELPGPLPGDDAGGTSPLGSPAYVDSAELLIMESYPVQVAVWVEGNLPTPCHEFRYQYEIQDFGAEKRMDITVYSEADPAALCTQVLEPFEERILLDLENAPEGTYVVYVNGELVGEFNYPA
jgi:inhibitor of cysteine peptidase